MMTDARKRELRAKGRSWSSGIIATTADQMEDWDELTEEEMSQSNHASHSSCAFVRTPLKLTFTGAPPFGRTHEGRFGDTPSGYGRTWATRAAAVSPADSGASFTSGNPMARPSSSRAPSSCETTTSGAR